MLVMGFGPERMTDGVFVSALLGESSQWQ